MTKLAMCFAFALPSYRTMKVIFVYILCCSIQFYKKSCTADLLPVYYLLLYMMMHFLKLDITLHFINIRTSLDSESYYANSPLTFAEAPLSETSKLSCIKSTFHLCGSNISPDKKLDILLSSCIYHLLGF
ncbi:hypothetical protein M6B38_267665 [Iris pallida]|uniref:Uncharacterized protein n=1 Tax=Iris pallida TaxID=29817 RepID=A0AAX6DIE2_IRIPA|nr:hypothetical protein M6B38_243750 [Iris pallida]KAJ6849573.1 hypothetical protein M6B38_267665 [Iris pallida]